MRRLLVLLLIVAFSGCMGSASGLDTYKDRTITAVLDSGVAPANRTGDQFYVVWVHGEEHAKKVSGKGELPRRVCSAPPEATYDPVSGTVSYDSRTTPPDTRGLEILVVMEYRGDHVLPDAYGAGCAAQFALEGYAGRAEFHRNIRADLAVDLIGQPQNGFLTYNKGYFFPVGKKLHVNVTRVEKVGGWGYYATGDFEIVNLGLHTADQLVERR